MEKFNLLIENIPYHSFNGDVIYDEMIEKITRGMITYITDDNDDKLFNKCDIKEYKKNLDKKYYFVFSSHMLRWDTFEKILDFEINENKIYVSKVIRDKNCFYMLVDFAILNQQFLTFKNIFSTINIECVEKSIQAGKIEILENKILLTTGADILKAVKLAVSLLILKSL